LKLQASSAQDGSISRQSSCLICAAFFVENRASARVQKKIGFAVDGQTTLFSRPRNGTFPHTNTVLTRARFRSLAR